MKRNLLMPLIFLLLGGNLTAQSQRITQLEAELKQSSDEEQLLQLLQLSHLYLEENIPSRALQRADLAEPLAKKIGDKEYRAQALNLQAHALLAINRKQNKKTAFDKFKRSLRFLKKSSNYDLVINNLEAMQVLARNEGDQALVEDLEKEIAEWNEKARTSADASPNEKKKFLGNLFKNKKVKEIEAKNEDLSAKLETLDIKTNELAVEKELLYLEKAELDLEKEKLDQLISAKEQKIQLMNERQAKAELLAVQQKNILDSLRFSKIFDKLRLEKQDLILEQKEIQLNEQQAKLELQRSQRNFLLAIAALGILLAIGLFARYLGIKKYNTILQTKNEMIREEQKRSEKLLLNILPEAIASELKSKGVVETVQFDKVTVLFTDFKDFSKISKLLTPKELVADLDYCFKAFDQIIGKYRMEKIKTIGDAYMCAGGLPDPQSAQPVDVINAALEIQSFLHKWKEEKKKEGTCYFEARIGIHTGPIVAGVVGEKKFAYDIWGDTVNIAARMETCGVPGKVNISQTTYELVKDHFSFNARGKVPAKNIGEIEMFFVESAKA